LSTLTYIARSTDSDLTGSDLPTLHNQLLGTTTATAVTKSTGNIPVGTTASGFAWTAVGVPGTSGHQLADVSVSVDISGGNTSLQLSVAVARVNSSGVVQAASATSDEQTASAGTKVVNFTALDLGTWSAGDRLRVEYLFRNTHASMVQAATVRYNTTASTVESVALVAPVAGDASASSPASTAAGTGVSVSPAPQPPTDLTATAQQGPLRVVLEWVRAAGDTGGYRIERRRKN
jgi:hypothetical protein